MADIQNVVFGAFQGRSMNPDVILCQEFVNASAVTAFQSALNTAPGSSGNWLAAPFTDGNDTDTACFYRADRIDLVSSTIISVGGNSPLPPRDTKRYDLRLKGYAGLGPKVAFYCSHMKSGSTTDDEQRRGREANNIRANAEGLDSSYAGFGVVGDFNTPGSTDQGFANLVANMANNNGRSFDPIMTSGTWNNASSMRFVDTQDPSANGGMDSRYDFILLSNSLRDGQGFDYFGSLVSPYSTSTWDDPNHSYRAWGNDGTSFNSTLTVTNNQMVGPVIAQSIINAATPAGGHIPVFLDMRVPAEIAAAPGSLNFGNVVQGSSPTINVDVSNDTDTVLWRTGIADLSYTLSANNGFTAPGGSFIDAAGGAVNHHSIGLNTSTLGAKNGTLTVASPVPGVAPVSIPLSGNVIPDAIAPDSLSLLAGQISSGGVAQLLVSDDQRVNWRNDNWASGGRLNPVFQVVFEGTSSLQSPASMTFELEAQAAGQYAQDIELYDFVAGAYVKLDTHTSTPVDSTVVVTVPNAGRYVELGTRKLRARISETPTAWSLPRVLTGGIDRAVWKPR